METGPHSDKRSRNIRADWCSLLLRRGAAYLIDVACILAYAAALLLVTVLAFHPSAPGPDHSVGDAIRGELLGFATLTGPVMLAMAWLEASRWQASPGKRWLGLAVERAGGGRLSLGRSLARNAFKFLPWELAHAGVHLAFVTAEPWNAVGLALSTSSMLLVAAYVASSALLQGPTLYDWLLGTRVTRVDRL